MSDCFRICYVLSYYAPNYVRTRTLLAALRVIPGLTLYEARNTSTGPWRYVQSIWRLIKVRLQYHPRYYILGFRGYELFWIVRLFTLGQILIYDHMMSPYDSLIHERKCLREGSLAAKLVRWYEKGILRAADRVLSDTEAHCRLFRKVFDLPVSKIVAIPVGADEELFRSLQEAPVRNPDQPFRVLFYGSFLPLHGVQTVLKAAVLLREQPVHFTLIGGNQSARHAVDEQIKQLGLIRVRRIDWVDFETLPGLIAHSDLGLGGPFGGTGQARRVITGKTFQFLAMGRPVVVGATDVDAGFLDKLNCLLVPQSDARALAEAILWARNHPRELKKIGEAGQALFKSRYSVDHISQELRRVFT